MNIVYLFPFANGRGYDRLGYQWSPHVNRMGLFFWIEHLLRTFAHAVPLEVFVFVGSFAEEVVSPIPSTLVMGIAGTAAAMNREPILYLVWLAFFGSFGKILGAWVYYALGDKIEDVVVRRYGKYFGVTHEQIESIGKRFTGSWKDSVLLFTLRLLPFVPTTPVSIACGIIRMRLPEFLVMTYIPNFIKDTLYLMVAYFGLTALRRFLRHVAAYQFHANILIAALCIAGLYLLWYHRRKGVWLWEKLRNKFRNQVFK